GAYKNPKTYEAFEPEEVGLVRQIIIGKHSGSASIIKKFSEFGIELDNEKANEILNKVRKLAVELKRPLFDKELIQLYQG
ncbi:MAG: homocitrate synthase/isopropylmalate synthase family protein, partial [Bacillota bacterium]